MTESVKTDHLVAATNLKLCSRWEWSTPGESLDAIACILLRYSS